MFNVLPENLKKIFKNEYYVRIAIVGCFWIVFIQVCFLIFLLPSGVVSNIKQKELEQYVMTIEQTSASNTTGSAADTVVSSNQLLHTINTTLVYPGVKPYIDAVLAQKNSGIQIGELSYTVVSATGATITIQGVSATRGSLVSFVKAMQNSKQFSNVQLPVSDLTRDTDIQFTLTVTIGKTS